MSNKSPVLIVLSEAGSATASTIQTALFGSEIHALKDRTSGNVTFDQTIDHVQSVFRDGRPIIGLCASGILIRALAPLIADKWSEPPVLSVAEDGSAVVPLLGGHHGANDLAREIAALFDTQAAVTTSGDVHFNIALDQPPAGLVLANPQDAKPFMANLLGGAKVMLKGEHDWFSNSNISFVESGDLIITVSEEKLEGSPSHLIYHPRTVILGMGAERGVDSSEAITLAEQVLAESNLAPSSLAAVTSIDLKADEAALHEVAAHFGIPAWFYDVETLKEQEYRLETPSDVVKAEIGVAGVAEASALVAAGKNGALMVPKQKSARVTAALAKAPDASEIVEGAPRGRVFLIGVGPGRVPWRSGEAIGLLSQASDWVGYDLYLDLVADLRKGQTEHRFPLGAEEKRVRYALELAAQSKDVAVICSGDPGIFAMATLAYELIDTGAAEGPVSDAAKRVEIVVAPGISAFQAAAARAGAPIGHDFCCISLSDLLTPRNDILKRLQAAAEGDFVVSFYNPRSKRRVTLLDEAFDILREYRPDDTPVILATDLGRPAEKVKVETLASVKSEDVDMLTLVMIGSSNSKTVTTGDGKTWVYTPRGYDRKEI